MAPNSNYLRGRRLEYELVSELLTHMSEYSWAQRMAGSHSPYDVIGVDPASKRIFFIQAKTKLSNETKLPAMSEYLESTGWTVIRYKRTKFIKRRNATNNSK